MTHLDCRDVNYWLLTFGYWLFATFLLLPFVVLIVMSFKDASLVGFPINAWSIRWYVHIATDFDLLDAVRNSLSVMVVSTLAALLLGLWTALFLDRLRIRGTFVILAVVCLPVVSPGIISGISSRVFIFDIGLETGLFAVVLGHTIHSVPFVALMILTRLRHMPPSLVEAALDLGATEFGALRRVVLPFLRPALVGAGVFAALLSFDDFNRSFFLGGYEPMLPILIYSKLEAGVSPEINAIATLVLLVTCTLGFLANRSLRSNGA